MNTDFIDKITYNNDNLSLLKIVEDLLKVVINDIKYMNDVENDYINEYDLGNNTFIKKEDLESIVSIIDTINDIKNYNEEV